ALVVGGDHDQDLVGRRAYGDGAPPGVEAAILSVWMRSTFIPRSRVSSEPRRLFAGRQVRGRPVTGSTTSRRSRGGPLPRASGRARVCTDHSGPTVKRPRGTPEGDTRTSAGGRPAGRGPAGAGCRHAPTRGYRTGRGCPPRSGGRRRTPARARCGRSRCCGSGPATTG